MALLLLIPAAATGASVAAASVTGATEASSDLPTILRSAGIQPIEPPSPAIDLELPELRGGSVRLSSATGNWLLLTFWATWCQPCVQELPTLDQLERELDGTASTILTIAIDDEREPAAAFLDRLDLALPALWDEQKRAAVAYRASSIPLSYVIDPTGRIVGVTRGARDWSQTAPLFAALEAAGPAPGSPSDLAWNEAAEPISLPIRLTPPSAEVLLSDLRPRLGSKFFVDVAVEWAGDFEEYLLRTPRIPVPEGLEQLDVSARTGSAMGQSTVTYRFELAARDAGRYALDPVELRYVPRFETEPVSTLVDGVEVEVESRSERWGAWTLVLAALGLAGSILAGVGLGVALRRRRESEAAPAASDHETEWLALLNSAKRHRFEGEQGAAVEDLHAAVVAISRHSADPAGLPRGTPSDIGRTASALLPELQSWVERCRFGGQVPPPEDLDRLQRRVTRLVDDLVAGESKGPAEELSSGRQGAVVAGSVKAGPSRADLASEPDS